MKKTTKKGFLPLALLWTLSTLFTTSCSTDNEDLIIENELSSSSVSYATPTAGKIYTIQNLRNGLTLDIANASNSNLANLQLWGNDINTTATNRQWEVISVGDGYVRLKGVDSGKVLQTGTSTANGENVNQYAYANAAWQEWELSPTGDGYFAIINRNSNKALRSLGNTQGSNVQVWQWRGWRTQKWLFTEVSNSTPTVPGSGFINTSDGTFQLNDFQIESSSHLSSTTSTSTTSWDYDDTAILGTEWYNLSGGDYYLKSASNDGKRTEWKEYSGIESSLNTSKVMKYEASITEIPENGITIAQVHNRFNESDSYRTRRPLLRVYIEEGKIHVKKTNNDLTNTTGTYDPTTIGPAVAEGEKFKVQITTGGGNVNVKVETDSGTLDQNYTPNTTVSGYSDYQNHFYLKAGAYTEGNDTEPIIRFYSFEKS